MSKANRRRQRPGSRPPAAGRPRRRHRIRPARPSRSAPRHRPAASTSGAGRCRLRRRPPAGRRPTVGGTPRPTGAGPRPSSAARHGRRERQRLAYKPSFMERYRTAIVVVAALAGVALLSAFVFVSASQPAFACSTIWTPAPTASPAASATPNLGYVQPDMGHQPRPARREGDLHVLRARFRQPLHANRRPRSRPASTARATASSPRAGSTTSNTVAWSSSTRARARVPRRKARPSCAPSTRRFRRRRDAARSSPGSTR